MMKLNRSFTRAASIGFIVLNLAGCSNMDEAQQRMVSGGAIGVAAGALGTVVTGGCIACGMAIGGAVGTAGGYIVDQLDHTTKSNPSVQNTSYNSGGGGGNGGSGVPQGYPSGGSYGSQ